MSDKSDNVHNSKRFDWEMTGNKREGNIGVHNVGNVVKPVGRVRGNEVFEIKYVNNCDTPESVVVTKTLS